VLRECQSDTGSRQMVRSSQAKPDDSATAVRHIEGLSHASLIH
jgi:hypothetical protein